jgi:hypothetical protein
MAPSEMLSVLSSLVWSSPMLSSLQMTPSHLCDSSPVIHHLDDGEDVSGGGELDRVREKAQQDL